MKTTYKLLVLYFNLAFVTYLKVEESQLCTSRFFLILGSAFICIAYILPVFLPAQYVFDNTNSELLGMRSDSPFLTVMIYFYSAQHAFVRFFCMFFMLWRHKKVMNLIIRCHKTFKAFKVPVNSEDFKIYEKQAWRTFLTLAFVGTFIKFFNFTLGSHITVIGLIINLISQPLEAIIYTFIQFVSMLLTFFLFLLKNSRLRYHELKHEELKMRFKSIVGLFENFNATLGFLLTSVLVNMALSVTFEVSYRKSAWLLVFNFICLHNSCSSGQLIIVECSMQM